MSDQGPLEPRKGPQGWGARLKTLATARTGFTAISALIVVLATPFLLVSEVSIKNYMDSWLSGCLFVLETHQVLPHRVYVRGYLSGKPPKSLPITFSVSGATINRIQMVNEVLTTERSTDSLALHPQTSWACPGTFCEEYGRDATAPKMTISLSDLNPDFPYAFHVDLDKPISHKDLRLFVQFDQGLQAGVCRVEEASMFNWFIRLSKLQKFFALLVAFIIASIAITTFKLRGEES